jgi:hypothetical protein
VRRRFSGASLLAEPGGTNHASTLEGNACVDDTIARYLRTGALPRRQPGDRPDAYCAPLPRPVPSGVRQDEARRTLWAPRASLSAG